MLGEVGMKRGLWVAYAVLLAAVVWLLLTASGKLGLGAKSISKHLPPLLTLAAISAIPVLAALCSLHLQIDWRARIALFLLLLACVPLLPIAFDSHPVYVVVVTAIFMVEEFGIVPLINRRWFAGN